MATRKERKNKLGERRSSHVKQHAFLKAYVIAGGEVARACRLAKVNRTTYYDWLRSGDEKFLADFELAKKRACQKVEDEIIRRAVKGVKKPVYQGGQLVGYVRDYSDTLLIFLAKAVMPEKYRERIDQQPLNIQLNVGQSVNGILESEPGYIDYCEQKRIAEPPA